MIIEKINENLKDIASLNDYHLERVYLEPEQLLKKILRVKSDHGTELGINLDDNQTLHDGDILFKDKNKIIAIFVNSSKVIRITPKNLHDMGYIAHQLGNRHLPAQFDENSMYVEYDYLVERLLKQLNIPYEVVDTKLKEPFRHINIEAGHDEVSHDAKKDINKDADKVHVHELNEHNHQHEDEHHVHSHEHSHGEYTHTHEHYEDDNEHHHIHNHDHEHRHGDIIHSHLHKVTDHHHDHDDFKNGAHTHDHDHKQEQHEHEHTHHSHGE